MTEVGNDLPTASGRRRAATAEGHHACVEPSAWAFRHRLGEIDLSAPRVMGIVNVTPDSFSDGGLWLAPEAALARGLALHEAGAALVDIGGESTRPGAKPVSAADEIARVVPVVEALAQAGVTVSIDTRKPEVARAAIEAGAAIVNDVAGLGDPAMRETIAAYGAGCVIMHMRGTPETMQREPRYADVVGEVRAFLVERARLAEGAGIDPRAVALDPGLGFGKTAAHNLALLRGLDALSSLDRPVLVGASRKSFLGALTGGRPPAERVAASVACALFAIDRGARFVRVHDVRETVDALRAWRALRGTGRASPERRTGNAN